MKKKKDYVEEDHVVGRPIFLKYKVVSIKRNEEDDGGVVVAKRCKKVDNRYLQVKNGGEITFVMDTNLPRIGAIVTATFKWS